ncbi:MAG: transglutaminase domain-containing protein [Polyangiaceae bacterium]|nr:transglutaminase domain-containing protein [Polyangiaceae bacterium]
MTVPEPSPPTATPSDDPRDYLAPGSYVDSDHPEIVAWARAHAGEGTALERAVRLFYAVRDGWRYDPYSMTLVPEDYKASRVLGRRKAFCVPKAVLLTAVVRAVGIPARLGFADVKNHLTSDKLREVMGTDVFAFHGYADVWLEGAWHKATPAFNRELCEHFHVRPLEWDGRSDALFHELSTDGRRHMEYLRDRGRHFDLPFDAMLAAFGEVYSFHKEAVPAIRDEQFHGA